MVRERIKELVDFATSESPYRDANKGWLNDDVYIQWGKSSNQSPTQGVEFANVSVFWKPINQIVSILFLVVLLATIFVFLTVSLSHGRLQIPQETPRLPPQSQPVVDQKVQPEPVQESKTDAMPEMNSVVEPKIEAKKTLQNSDFAAAALGGQKIKRQQ